MGGCTRIPLPDISGGKGDVGSPVKECAPCSCSVTLGNKRTLVPLGLVLYAGGKINLGSQPQLEWNTDISPTAKKLIAQPGTHDDPNLELVDFILKLDCAGKKEGETVLEKAIIEIQDASGKAIYSEDLANPKPRPFHAQKPPQYLTKGTHLWQWDGYDNNNVLDTANLKSGKLKAVLKTISQGVACTCEKIFSCKSPNSDWQWIDVRVNKTGKTVDMLWRLDMTAKPDSSVSADLVALAIDGVSKHWSRVFSVYAQNNEDYTLQTRAINKTQPVMYQSFTLRVDHTGKKRSESYFGNVYYDTTRKTESSKSNEFRYLASHEFGHIVLNMAYKQDVEGYDVSWNHKGTSSIAQNEYPDSPKYSGSAGELMWYYADGFESPWASYVAGKEDIRGAIWMAQIEFK